MKNIVLFVISSTVCFIFSCDDDIETPMPSIDCVNYSGCLENTGVTGQESHDFLGEFVMTYNDCLKNNIPEILDTIPTHYNLPNDFAPVKDSLGTVIDSFDCRIPFYANLLFGTLTADSIKASIKLRFNSIFDNIDAKTLAIEWIINDESKKCNDSTFDFYTKTDGTTLYNVNCIIYSTDFSNVYVRDLNFSFAVKLSKNQYNELLLPKPIYTNINNVAGALCACDHKVACGPMGYGTVGIILPFPG